MTAHRDLSGSDVHEPKGVEDASTGQVYVADGSGSGAWSSFTATIPIGSVIDYCGTSAPTGWLFSYGQDVSRTTYANLFAVLSTTYGVGDGSTTFTLPDLRGRVVAGQDDMGGSSANRLTNQTGGLNGDTLGATGGVETHTLTQAQLPNYNLTLTSLTVTTSTDETVGTALDTDSAGNLAGGGGQSRLDDADLTETTVTSTGTVGGTLASGGSGSAHNIVQPTIILNKIIYHGVE